MAFGYGRHQKMINVARRMQAAISLTDRAVRDFGDTAARCVGFRRVQQAGSGTSAEIYPSANLHEKMVTIRVRRTRLVDLNKKVYICCLAVVAMLAASPMRAAESAGSSSLLAPQANAGSNEGKVSTIRVDRRTGKLVRVVSGSQAAGSQAAGPQAAGTPTPGSQTAKPVAVPAPPARIGELVERSARAHQVDPLLVQSVMQVESNYNPYAVSRKGAEGLMQLMPSTSRMLGVTNSFDPVENIEAGVKYLKYLQSLYHDDRLALAAYNAGPSAVTKFSEVPPYPETQNYVERVGQRYRAAREAAGAPDAPDTSVAGDAQTSPPEFVEPVETHPKLEQFIDSDGRLHLTTATQ